MKFVDEASISVCAGNGGAGCLSFLREKYRPKGGPDGGDGGNGGDVILQADPALNTLADFRHKRKFSAKVGGHGSGKNRHGKNGQPCVIKVPLGTSITEANTREHIVDICNTDTNFIIARGGRGGAGNARFKSSTNQSPRYTSKGLAGEQRDLLLELQVLADVGLLGLPNAGKSTLLRAVSNARPKVADYPFTTLHPQLGMVELGAGSSFVVADIPGLIKGAAEGAGLGFQFLRHLRRTVLLLHIVDMSVVLLGQDPLDAFKAIEHELAEFGHGLLAKPRWLVLNKCDVLTTPQRQELVPALITSLNWHQPVFAISAINGDGCQKLTQAIMAWITTQQLHSNNGQRSPAR